MGFQLGWIAVRSRSADPVYAELGFRRTGSFEGFPESPFVGTRLPSGWSLVVMDHSAASLDGTVDLARLSRLGDVVACFVEEHAMYSRSELWASGRMTWSLTHEAQQGLRHLEKTGREPVELAQAVKTADSELAANGGDESDVDFHFEVPLVLAKVLTGFKHDESIDGDVQFEVLEPTHPRWNAKET